MNTIDHFQEREKYTSTIAWAIPSNEAINEITNFVGQEIILEIGAGLGYWAKLLQDKGVIIIPTDNKETFWKHSKQLPYTKVIRARHITAIKKYKEASVLFLCWPPHNKPMAEESLNLFKGRKLIYIGEDQEGCNATDGFFSLLEKEWSLIKNIHIEQWWGLNDYLALYERKIFAKIILDIQQ